MQSFIDKIPGSRNFSFILFNFIYFLYLPSLSSKIIFIWNSENYE